MRLELPLKMKEKRVYLSPLQAMKKSIHLVPRLKNVSLKNPSMCYLALIKSSDALRDLKNCKESGSIMTGMKK
jgi:hypothetical protein